MIEIVLIFLLLILFTFGIIEFRGHEANLSRIPIRIHVNGSRGKSSVTRLIAAGLRSGGFKTVAKTTGSSPRVIDETGRDRYLHRLRSASIGEQIRLIRRFSKSSPDALVIECMAVNPQYQWISEHKIVRSTIGVLTNSRPDHLDEMGMTIEDITRSMSNTIPYDGKMITSEKKNSGILKDIANQRGTELKLVEDEIIKEKDLLKFGYIEHSENIALSLEVCRMCGVKKDVALKGMINCTPDPGALTIWKVGYESNNFTFINAFAANDPESTIKTWNIIKQRFNNKEFSVFLNSRSDRLYRTIQLIHLVSKQLKPTKLIVRGDSFPAEVNNLLRRINNIEVYRFPYNTKSTELIRFMSDNLNDNIILGIGNIVGWGESFMKKMRKFRID